MRAQGAGIAVGLLPTLLLLSLVGHTLACFIRNCPPGGKKRALTEADAITKPREVSTCARCGPYAVGQCVGPNICCGNSFGCYINTAESDMCQHENDSPVACQVEGEPCGAQSRGRCVADGVCCTDETCSVDGECRIRSYGLLKRSGASPDVINYVRKLLKQHSFPERR